MSVIAPPRNVFDVIETWEDDDAKTEDDAYCELHGHMPDCPHDMTDWDSINKETQL